MNRINYKHFKWLLSICLLLVSFQLRAAEGELNVQEVVFSHIRMLTHGISQNGEIMRSQFRYLSSLRVKKMVGMFFYHPVFMKERTIKDSLLLRKEIMQEK